MDQPFGAPIGPMGGMPTTDLSDGFATINSVSIEDMAQSDRIQPRQMGTGGMRGTQRIMNTDGSYITLGVIPNTSDFGIAFFDSSDNLISKITALTDYVYDPTTGKNVYQSKKLPDGTYGVAGANTGFNVSDGF